MGGATDSELQAVLQNLMTPTPSSVGYNGSEHTVSPSMTPVNTNEGSKIIKNIIFACLIGGLLWVYWHMGRQRQQIESKQTEIMYDGGDEEEEEEEDNSTDDPLFQPF